jgi:hypothetical protein
MLKEPTVALSVGQGADELEAAQQVTLGFNRARIREAAGQLTAAAAEYKVRLLLHLTG